MPDAFDRTRLVLGAEALTKLKNARVAVFGLGGVGGAAVEALARSGVGSLELIDSDTVAVTNLNRQLIATHTTLGMKKTEAAKARVLDINPDCRVTARDEFFLPENADAWDFTAYDYVIDAVDTVAAKLCLAERCAAAGTPMNAKGIYDRMEAIPMPICISIVKRTDIPCLTATASSVQSVSGWRRFSKRPIYAESGT